MLVREYPDDESEGDARDDACDRHRYVKESSRHRGERGAGKAS